MLAPVPSLAAAPVVGYPLRASARPPARETFPKHQCPPASLRPQLSHPITSAHAPARAIFRKLEIPHSLCESRPGERPSTSRHTQPWDQRSSALSRFALALPPLPAP